jgi:hypothetical protein
MPAHASWTNGASPSTRPTRPERLVCPAASHRTVTPGEDMALTKPLAGIEVGRAASVQVVPPVVDPRFPNPRPASGGWSFGVVQV